MPTRGKRLALLAATFAVVVLGVAAWRGWPHLRFWWLFEPMGENAQGLPEYRHRATGIVMVRVPGATFWMGSPDTEAERRGDEGPVHEVTLSPFLISKYEVSQREWQRIMGSNPGKAVEAALPATGLSWDDAEGFCRKVGLELPTEAQWEYACRAATSTPFWFGATISLEQVNYRGDLPYVGTAKGVSRDEPLTVDSLKPNGFGLHHMHGNAWEWCRDVYDFGFYATPAASQMDPLCTTGSDLRVNRGGCFFLGAGECRSACRYGDSPGDRGGLGVRPVYCPLP